MSHNNQGAIIACLPVAWSPYAPVPSALSTCHVCNTSVWISETLSPRVLTGELSTVCLVCLAGVLETRTDVEAQLHPDQLAELANAGVLEEARAMVEYFNRHRAGGDGGTR